MNDETNLRVRKAMQEWASVHTWSNRYAVTLTMKQCLITPSSRVDQKTKLDDKMAIRNFRHFMNLMNDEVYCRSDRRKGIKIRVIPTWETSENDRLHGHAIFERPSNCTDAEFRRLLKEKWSKTDWAYHQIHITYADSGWLKYMLKFEGKESVADSIDWENVHNPR